MKQFTPAWRTTALAKKWSCTSRHIIYLIDQGQLKSIKIGKRMHIIPNEEVERFEQCGWSGTETDGASTLKEEKESPAVQRIVYKQNENSQTTSAG